MVFNATFNINSLPHDHDISRPYIRSLLKTLQEKDKMLAGFSLGSESQESMTLGAKFSRVKMKFTRVKEHRSRVENTLLLWKDQAKKQVSIYYVPYICTII